MAEKATLARPYAKAAFEYAHEKGQLARWSEALAAAGAVVSDPQAERLLSNPRITSQQLVDLIADVCRERIDEPARQFLTTLAANRRLDVLPHISMMFDAMRAEVEQVADVHVTSAIQLNEAQRARLTAALRKRLKREVRLHCVVDPALIGGAIVRSGDLVIDGSLQAQLDRLTQVMTQ